MTGDQFKTARKARLKYSQSELATAMQTPKRTIQELEAKGAAEIRGVYAVCIELLIWKSRLDMQTIKENIERDMDRAYPDGIRG